MRGNDSVAPWRTGAKYPIAWSGGLVSSFISFLTLMLILPGLATVAAYATVGVSVWREGRRTRGDSAARPEMRSP
ncbi:hypothetical protein [Nocardia sp. R6R-6]|uniref:hypothetical protein n=1 Tax=Nocardia sp. R6R-6 TaxID=3459303 RepID=UPI00403D94B9